MIKNIRTALRWIKSLTAGVEAFLKSWGDENTDDVKEKE